MPHSLPEIIYKQTFDGKRETPTIDSDNSYYEIPFDKSKEYFDSLQNWTNFIKGVERLVRGDARYTKYISYLKKECKMDHCQVLKRIDDEDCKIEMHHGPIFTLFDICAIVTEYFLMKNWKVTTFRIAKQVLEDHLDNIIQVVMLSETVHEEVHARNIFINYHQAWGDMNKFVKKYIDAIGPEYRHKMNMYLDRCLLTDSTDNEILALNSRLYKE